MLFSSLLRWSIKNTKNSNEFTYPYYGSMVYWVTKGYVVLDDASFPIIGEDENEPNDNFRNQLVANAELSIMFFASSRGRMGICMQGRLN